MPTIPQQLLTITRQPSPRGMHSLLSRFEQVIDTVKQADRLFVLSLRSATPAFLDLDEDDLPPALFWSPSSPDREPDFLLDDEARWRLAGDTLTSAMMLTTTPPGTLNEAPSDTGTQTLFEKITDVISGNQDTRPGISLLWAESLIMEPSSIILMLSLEDDVYAVVVGENLSGEIVAAVIGQQPFEGVLEPEAGRSSTEVTETATGYAETIEDDAAHLEGRKQPERGWWGRLRQRREHTLLRATWLQLLMGEPLALMAPEEAPEWPDVPLLPVESADSATSNMDTGGTP